MYTTNWFAVFSPTLYNMNMMTSHRTYTVSELNAKIRSLLEGNFPYIQVAGEVSSLRKPYSGHLYFTLKDQGAQLKAVLFKMQQRYLSEHLEDGKQVLCRGRISVYEPRGDYQLLVDTVEFGGTGNLQAAYERLKKKLASEGLFAQEIKKELPEFPRQITLITSPGGAAVHDFIKIATRRWPSLHLLVYPVTVQGDKAAGEMIDAIRDVNSMQSSDIIVLCRGGGSIEDLWAYNNEELAREIRASNIPVVSAVGHEIDFTIADFVADMRAPTPSGAAELIVPERTLYTNTIRNSRTALLRALQRSIKEIENKVLLLSHRLGEQPHPIDTMLLKVGQLSISLEHGMTRVLEDRARRLQSIANRLAAQNPKTDLLLTSRHILDLQNRLLKACKSMLQEKKHKLAVTAGVLDAVSPLATLARGYSVAERVSPPRMILTDAAQAREGEQIGIRLYRGKLLCRVEESLQASDGETID